MQVIIPLAGKGTRLRPHTHTKAKPLVHVAGKPILAHVLDRIKDLDVSEIIFVYGYLGDQIKDYVKSNYSFKSVFVEQKEMRGQAHAIHLAKEHVKEDFLIIFVDTIFDVDLKPLSGLDCDGAIFVSEVEDARRFGVVVPDENNVVKQLIEKPDEPPSNLVNIGLYYVKNNSMLFDAIEEMYEKDVQTKGEYYLMDAFQLMIDKGAKFLSRKVDGWYDCGKPETLLATNKTLLEQGNTKVIDTDNSVIIEPVYIEEGAKITGSVIGPNVSIAKDVKIEGSVIHNSIINLNSEIRSAVLDSSIIGDNAKVEGKGKSLNVGDNSEVRY